MKEKEKEKIYKVIPLTFDRNKRKNIILYKYGHAYNTLMDGNKLCALLLNVSKCIYWISNSSSTPKCYPFLPLSLVEFNIILTFTTALQHTSVSVHSFQILSLFFFFFFFLFHCFALFFLVANLMCFLFHFYVLDFYSIRRQSTGSKTNNTRMPMDSFCVCVSLLLFKQFHFCFLFFVSAFQY